MKILIKTLLTMTLHITLTILHMFFNYSFKYCHLQVKSGISYAIISNVIHIIL
jgi:hypothetical protein